MEVAVDNFESAINAEKGGAIRIELCSALSEGGLTPSVGFLKKCKETLSIPVFTMIRCRNGDFNYTTEEMKIMADDMKVLKDNGADGFVFGILKEDKTLDIDKCNDLLDIADNKPCTLHRAFDEIVDVENALETAINLGFKRILTSGQKNSALDGLNTIQKLIKLARNRIIIMPGAGINCNNVKEILLAAKPKEFHGSAKETVTVSGYPRNITSSRNVAMMVSTNDLLK